MAPRDVSRGRAEVQRAEKGGLVAEAGRDGDLVTALGAAAVEDGLSGLGGHTDEEAVNFGAAAAVGLECALRHGDCPVYKASSRKRQDLNAESFDVCWIWPGSFVLRASGGPFVER